MAKNKESLSTRAVAKFAPSAAQEIAASAAEAAVEQAREVLTPQPTESLPPGTRTPEQVREDERASLAQAAEAGSYAPDMVTAGNFIPASANGTGPVSQLNWHRMATIVEKQLDQIPISGRLHEGIRDHTLGLGITVAVTAKNKNFKKYEQSLYKVVFDTIFGKINRLDALMPQLIMERSAVGETLLHVDENPIDGSLVIAYMDPRSVTTWTTEQPNRSNVVSIVTQDPSWKNYKRGKQEFGKMVFAGEPTAYKVVRMDTDFYERDEKGVPIVDDKGKPKSNPFFGLLNGEVFWWRDKKLPSQGRGRGHTFSQVDWINTVDQGIYDFLRRFDAQAAVVWDLLIKGGTEKEINMWAKIPLPRGRQPFTHNERFVLEPKSPSLKIEDLSSFIKTLVTLIAGTVGFPEFMMGNGADTNVATAKEQSPALYAKFDNNRGQWESDLGILSRYAVERANAHGMLGELSVNADGDMVRGEKKVFTNEELDQFEIGVKFKPFERSNAQALGIALKSLLDALIAARTQGFMSLDLGIKIFQAQAAQLGVTIDPESEKTQLANEKATKGTTPSGNEADYQDLT